MDFYGSNFLYRNRTPGPMIPGLVRMDRAVLYIRQRLRGLITELEARKTKTIGETGYYQISRLVREAYSFSSMSGDRQLADLIAESIRGLSSRTIRLEGIASVRDLLGRLESYEPPSEAAGYDELRDKVVSLEQRLGEGELQKITDEQLTSEKSVFVVMPFAAEFSDVWKGGIQRAAQAEGFMPIRVDMINRSTNITDDIVTSIDKCRLAIVDVTGNNPNVMFELGYTIAKEKRNIIISQSADFLPFDIRNIRTIVYANTWSGIEDLKNRIQEFLRETVPARHRRASKN